MTVRKRVVIAGRVQGVFYRDSCRRLADNEGVRGWVANTDSGDVEACFEGEEPAVNRMVEWCRSGPEGAEVRSVTVTDEPPQGEAGFTVL